MIHSRVFLTALLVILSMLVYLFTGCSEGRTTVISEEELEELRAELATDRCISNLDSLRFALEGEIYWASIEGDSIPHAESLLPDSVYRCPVTGEFYDLIYSEETITISCPAGHGTVTVFK